MKTNVATINSQLLAGIQAVLEPSDTFQLVAVDNCDLFAEYLSNHRTAGFTLPPAYIDYTLFKDYLTNPDIRSAIIVPTLDDWSTIRDSFNYDAGPGLQFRVYDEEGTIVDAYRLGSTAHLKLAKRLKINATLREIVITSPIAFVANGMQMETPRGFCFKLQAESNGFVVKQLMARYLGKVHMFNEISNKVTNDYELIPLLDRYSKRVELDIVVVYEASRFFDKVRRRKFYQWLATQAKTTTKVILIN